MRILIDLDNTLVDRDAAFRRWAEQFVADAGGSTDDAVWLVETDAHGYTARDRLAARLRDRLGLTDSVTELVGRMLMEHVGDIACYAGVEDRLRELAQLGASLVIVTNGTVAQQTAKLTRTGLDDLVERVVISEAAGVKKPDPRIFAAAVDRLPPDSETWMIGDHPRADIAGGAGAGLRTGWVSHGAAWDPADGTVPDLLAPTTAALLDRLVGTARGRVDD